MNGRTHFWVSREKGCLAAPQRKKHPPQNHPLRAPNLIFRFLKALSHTSFYLRRSRQIRERKELFLLFLLLLLGDLGGLFFNLPCTLKMGVPRENFSSKWVYPGKTFLQNGCIAAKLMHQNKTLLQNGCIKSLSFTEFRKRIILFLLMS